MVNEPDNTRMCVNCGRERPASEGRDTPHPDCTSPDACSWDLTLEEAWQYWRQKYHDLHKVVGQINAIAYKPSLTDAERISDIRAILRREGIRQ